ncbi:hypothetical protein MMC09_002199 [Bachmanniomyces sp. S44760]|nr:hypothetical protein [Bachmanniomyces sp. S44760]
MSAFFNFIYSQLFITPPYPTKSQTGRTIIVTGANGGLGFEAARHFVRLGASKVIIACRTLSKGETAKANIEATEAGSKEKKILEVWHLDLASYDSVKAFAARAQGLERLDAVVENAGVVNTKWSMVEKDETTITTNVVSTFLLALLILPKLRESAAKFDVRPTLTIVTSEVHGFTNMPYILEKESIFDALRVEEGAKMEDRYNVSKLLEVLFCRALTTHLLASSNSNPSITFNCVNPGLCQSNLVPTESAPLIFRVLTALLARTTEVGSRTLVHAGGVAGEETMGEYLSDCVVTA